MTDIRIKDLLGVKGKHIIALHASSLIEVILFLRGLYDETRIACNRPSDAKISNLKFSNA